MALKNGQYSSVDELPDLLQAKKTDYKSVDELPDLKKKSTSVSSSTGGTVGSSNPPSANSTNPFAIGGQYNQPPKLEAERLDLSNTQKNAALAEQAKKPLKKIPMTPILDNPVVPKPISEIDAQEAIARQQQHKIDMETAIDNTTLKVLKQKGIVAGKGSPYYEAERKKIEEKTKPTTIGGIVVARPEATFHKDKEGNIGLDRNLGFVEGIRKGFNDAVNGEDEANAFAAMSTEQKVKYANEQMQGKPTEYMQEHGGVGEIVGGAAPYMVKAATAATLATAAGIIAPETGGASLAGAAPVLTVLLTAPDMIKQGAKDEVMTRYMQLKQERPEADEVELMKIAEQGELSGQLLGAANALAFTTSLKLPVLNDAKSVLKKYINGVASSAVHLGGITAAGKAAQLAERKLEGYNVDTDKAIGEVATTFADNATAGAVLNGLISGVHTLPKVIKSAYKYALKDTPTSEIKTALDANVQAGRIPPEVAEQTVADIDGYKAALAKTSDGLKPETQASVAGLIQARDNVAAEMATKDPTQRAVYEQKIEAFNKQIEKITETNDPLKYEVDEVTGNPIDKVAPPKELTFEDKVRETYPTLKEANDKEVGDFIKENATDDPIQFIEKFGKDKFDEIVKDIPTKDLQDKLDMVIKGNADSPNVDILDKIISQREKAEAKKPSFPLPKKPVDEMTATELEKHIEEVKDYQKKTKLTKEQEDALTPEQSDEYYGKNLPKEGVYDPTELQRIRNRVSEIEGAETISDIAATVKRPLIDFARKQDTENLAVIKAAKRQADKLGISTEEFTNEINKQIKSEFGKDADAMSKVVFKAIETPSKEVVPDVVVDNSALGVEGVANNIELRNDGLANAPTSANVTERTNQKHPFIAKISDALKKLGILKGDGKVIGGQVQGVSKNEGGGFTTRLAEINSENKVGDNVGELRFNDDGSIRVITKDGTIHFDKNGNVISHDIVLGSSDAKDLYNTLEGSKQSIIRLEKIRDSDDFKYKTAEETDGFGNRKNVKRLKTNSELSESTKKINDTINKAKEKLKKTQTEYDALPEHLKPKSESLLSKEQPQEVVEPKPIKNEEAKAIEVPKSKEKGSNTAPTVSEVTPETKAGEGGKKEPPKEPTEPIGEAKSKKEGITHAAVEELRKIIGEPEYEGKPVEKHEQLIEEAQKTIKDNPNAANEVLDKMENKGKITNKDNAIIAIYKATIDAEMAKAPTPELLKRATRLAKALDVSGTELGKALESRKLVGKEDNITNFLLEKQAAQGTALTEAQLKTESKKYEDLKAAYDALEKQSKIDKEQYAKDIAEMGLNKAKAKARRESKKSSEDYKKERKDTVEAARKALKDIRDNPQASVAPLFRELTAIAPHVKEYVNSLVSEGVDKLDNIVTAVHAEFKDVLDGLTKRDVLDIMAGDYSGNPKDQTRNEKANTARLLEREAKLLKELERERKGEEKAKTESQKTQSNRRIDELKEKIKEVRRLNKNREVDTESPEDATAGEIEYNTKLQKQLTEKAQKLTNDIRNKKYLEEEPAKPVFKKSRKTQILEDRVIDLENKIRHERSLDEYNKRSKAIKAYDKVMEVLGLRRLFQSALDMSVPFRQGATMLSPRKIDVWAKGFQANLKSIFNPKKFERIQYEIRRDPQYNEMMQDNVRFNDMNSADPLLHNEDFRKSFIYKIPIISEPLKASNRSADAFLNTARYEMYKKMRNNLEKKGYTRESDPEAFKDIGNWVMNMTGSGKKHKIFDSQSMNRALGNTFYGANLMASRLNLLNPLTYFDPRRPKAVRYEAMKDMVAFTTTMVTVATALSYTTGAKISLNPDDSDFLQIRYGDKVYDISGGLANYVRTGLRIAKAAYTKSTGTKYEGQKATDNAGKSIVNFLRNKLSPNTGYAVDAFFGGRYGNEFDPTDIARIYPMYTEDFLKAVKEEGGLMATSTVLLPNILGIGYGSYASKGQIDANLEDLLQRNMRSDEMNNEKIFNHNAGGRAVTYKEFNDFADLRDKKIEADLKVLFEKGINGKAYKDLTQEELVKETNYIKGLASREAKEELFGKDKKTRTEKRETKKLSKEHENNYKNN